MSPSFTHSTVAGSPRRRFGGSARRAVVGSRLRRARVRRRARARSVARDPHDARLEHADVGRLEPDGERVDLVGGRAPALVDLRDLVEDLLLELGEVVLASLGLLLARSSRSATGRSRRAGRPRRRSRSPSSACSAARRRARRGPRRRRRRARSRCASACPSRAPRRAARPARAPSRAGRASPRAGRGSSPPPRRPLLRSGVAAGRELLGRLAGSRDELQRAVALELERAAVDEVSLDLLRGRAVKNRASPSGAGGRTYAAPTARRPKSRSS